MFNEFVINNKEELVGGAVVGACFAVGTLAVKVCCDLANKKFKKGCALTKRKNDDVIVVEAEVIEP